MSHDPPTVATRSPLAAALLLGLCLGPPGPGWATDATTVEEAAGEPSTSFGETVRVEIVNIDVWVTDGDGEPVRGLGPGAFEVLRDGEPVDVTNFHAVADGRPVAPAPIAPMPQSEAGEAATGAPPAPRSGAADAPRDLPPEHRLWLVVYIDNYNLDPFERNRVLPALRAFLVRSLEGDARAMIVTFDRSLEVRRPFTDRIHQLEATLEELEEETGFRLAERREQMAVIERIDRAESPTVALSEARLFAEQQADRIDRSIDALRDLVDTLGGLPGRKALLHVSSGIPMAGGAEMFQAVGERYDLSAAYAEIPRYDRGRDFEQVARLANAHRVVFHAMDAGGLRSFEFGAAEHPGFLDPRLRMTLDSVVPENLQAPLRLVAGETGGRAIVNRNEVLPALDEVTSDLRTYYSLGISSSGADSGRYHEIEVRLRERRRGVRVRHRAGYRSKDADTRMRETLRSALLYTHEENPLGLEIALAEPEPHGDGRHWILPIRLRVPLREVVFVPRPDGRHEARLALYAGAVSDDGTLSEIDRAPLGVRVAPEHVGSAKREALLHSHRLLLDEGRKKLGVAIRDLVGGGVSIVTGVIEVGAGD